MNKNDRDYKRYQIIRDKDKQKLQELSRIEKENKAANLAREINSTKREKNRGKKVLVRVNDDGETVSNIFDPKTNTWSENQTRKDLNKKYEDLMKRVDAELNKGGKRTRRKRKRRRKSTKKKRKRKKTKKKRRKRRKRTKKSRY
mgnify:CR=1 FL=1